jgi:hypothetical protein
MHRGNVRQKGDAAPLEVTQQSVRPSSGCIRRSGQTEALKRPSTAAKIRRASFTEVIKASYQLQDHRGGKDYANGCCAHIHRRFQQRRSEVDG